MKASVPPQFDAHLSSPSSSSPSSSSPAPLCVPCQVILWDQQAIGMIQGVTNLQSLQLSGASIPSLTPEWGSAWYELLERHCSEMQDMLDKLTGIQHKG